MATLRTLLDTRRAKSDGSFNIIFRITHNRNNYSVNSGVSALGHQWNNKKSEINKLHPNANLLNLKIIQQYFKIQKVILQLDDEFSMEKLRFMIDDNPNKHLNITFKSFANKLITQMIETNKIGNALVYQTAVNQFLVSIKNEQLLFSEIDFALLEKFRYHLIKKGLKINSISNYIRTIRAIYNKAIKLKVVERSFYPFHEFSIKSEKTAKRAISKDDIIKMKQSKLVANSTAERLLNYFMLSFYLRGISFTDLAYLKHSNIIDGRVEYKRRKTHKNYSIKLFPLAETIINKMYFPGNDYLLPIIPIDVPEDSLRAKRIIQQCIKNTNKYLKRLSEEVGFGCPVTTYTSRHSFATIAKRLGYSNELIAEALGHDHGNKITNIYLDTFEEEVLDAMHQHVIEM
jgi:site-specific recombinase XerD